MLFPSNTPLTRTNSEESAELENGREMGPFLEHEEVGIRVGCGIHGPDMPSIVRPETGLWFERIGPSSSTAANTRLHRLYSIRSHT